MAGTDEALGLLRRRQFQPALEILDSVGAELRALQGARPCMVQALGRLYRGVRAYYFYCTDHFDAAHEDLREAARCVQQAVQAERILLPLAHDCHEFLLHHARIARNQQRWDEMQGYTKAVRDMVENRRPLCELADGTAIDYHELAQHFQALPLDEDDQRTLRPFMDVGQRRHHFERFLVELYTLPGFVIPYS